MNILQRFRFKLYKTLLRLPFFSRYAQTFYAMLGVSGNGYRISAKITLIGNYKFLELGNQTEINTGCFLLVKDKISIGDNSTLAYQTTILTSANPNGPHNKLSIIYPKMTAPVIIGHDTWIGARAIILPGVRIGNYSIVAAGSVVNSDIPDYTVVAGIPAKVVKTLDPKIFE
ncbi:acyltransferase [Pseudoalteromonas sp. MelDa3]|nr:acyltransferase [Pseudoalteromonas sp. MelDa3]